jgi:hypothetical protein
MRLQQGNPAPLTFRVVPTDIFVTLNNVSGNDNVSVSPHLSVAPKTRAAGSGRGRQERETGRPAKGRPVELAGPGPGARRRLGHASTETTQLYALLDDKVADAEIRAARRRRGRSAS